MVEPRNDPSTQSGERKAMERAFCLISDVLAGAERIRSRGEAYLPRYEDESTKEYDRRRKTAPWRPEFADVLRGIASKPFDQDVGLKGDVSTRIKVLAEDVDGRGNSLTQFAATAFPKAIGKGVHIIVVDFPAMHPNATRAEELESGARPYWLHVEADAVVALHTSWVGGIEVIDHLRFRESVTKRDGFAEVKRERIRVLEPGRWEVYDLDPNDGTWSLTDTGVIARGSKARRSVPAALLFTGDRLGAFEVRPPLEQLAILQIELYQALSRLEEILTFAGAPMLTGNGLSPPKENSTVTVGPKTILYAPAGDQPASWEYISPDAANIREIREHVVSVQSDIRRLGMQPLARTSGSTTATAESIEASKAHSAVEAWAMSLKDTLEQAWVYTAEWLNEDPNVEVVVATDFDVMPFATAPLTALNEARARKDISRETFWDGMRRFDVLPQDFDPVVEAEKLKAEMAVMPVAASAQSQASTTSETGPA